MLEGDLWEMGKALNLGKYQQSFNPFNPPNENNLVAFLGASLEAGGELLQCV